MIHTTEKSIKLGVRKRVSAFKRDLTIEDETIVDAPWMEVIREIARERKDLPSFGIEIVTIEISDGKA